MIAQTTKEWEQRMFLCNDITKIIHQISLQYGIVLPSPMNTELADTVADYIEENYYE